MKQWPNQKEIKSQYKPQMLPFYDLLLPCMWIPVHVYVYFCVAHMHPVLCHTLCAFPPHRVDS